MVRGLANRERFIFDVDADITKASQRLAEIKKQLDEIDSLKRKGESRGNTTTNNDMISSMMHYKKATQEFKKAKREWEQILKQVKGANPKSIKNYNVPPELQSMFGGSKTNKKDMTQAVQKQIRQLQRLQDEANRAQRKMVEFGQTYSKSFKTNFDKKGIMHIDTKNLDEARRSVEGIVEEANNSSRELDKVIGKIREAQKLDRRSESLSRRASASKYMSHQQASNFTKDYQTATVTFKQDKADNMTRLTEIGTTLSKYAEQIKAIESKPDASVSDFQRREKLQASIKELDKEWQARTKLNKVLTNTTNNMEGYNESVQGVRTKANRNSVPGMLHERAPAIGLAITGAVAAAVGSLYHQGASASKGMRDQEIFLGQATGTKGDNWRTDIRNNAMKSGLKNDLGMTGGDMLSFQENYINKKGFTSKSDLNSAMNNQAQFSRAVGVNAEETKQFFDSVYGTKGVDGTQTKDIQNAFLGAIKQSGMEGREKDQLKALSGILQSVSESRSLSNREVMNVMGLQSTLAQSGISSLQGAKGGKLLSDLDQGIKGASQNPSALMAFGLGTEYQGLSGVAKIQAQMEKGISDPENLKKITNYAKWMGGNDKDAQSAVLSRESSSWFGTKMTIEQARGMMDLASKGDFSQESIDKVLKADKGKGQKESDARISNYKESSASTDNQSEATTEKQAVQLYDMGEVVRKANTALGGLPAPVYAAITAIGALALAAGAAAVSFGIAGRIKGATMGTYKNGGGGTPPVVPGGGGGTPPTGGGGTPIVPGAGGGNGGNAPRGYTTSPGGVIIPGSPTPTTPVVPGGANRQYSGNTSWWDKTKNFFDPSARNGGLPNPGSGQPIVSGGGTTAPTGGNRFGSNFKGGVKDSFAFKGLNKILLPLAVVSGISTIASASSEDKGKATGSVVGGIGGGVLGGAAAGAAIGSVVPVVGTAIGGILGGLAGGWAGSSLGGTIGGWFDPKKASAAEMTPEEAEKLKGKQAEKSSENAVKEQVDKENTNQEQRNEVKKTDNLALEKENLNQYEKTLFKMEKLLAQARSQNGIMGNGSGGSGGAGGGMVGGAGGGSPVSSSPGNLKFLQQGQKWQNAGNLQQSDLGYTEGSLTAEDLDNWINSKAPKDSMFRGMGATFLKAGRESGLDPRYLIAHAAEESAWGTSRIAKDKKNFFGIGAFDNSPYASAYGFGNTVESGITGGAKWIADKYYGKGNTTLDKMHQAGYATNSTWASNIASIMKGAPTGSGSAQVNSTINVNVNSGDKVSDKVKNSSDMKQTAKNIESMIFGSLNRYSYEMTMV